jgi:hypothetical protein
MKNVIILSLLIIASSFKVSARPLNHLKQGIGNVDPDTAMTNDLEPFQHKCDVIIYIYRLSSVVGSAVKWPVQVDASDAAKLGQKQYLVYHVSTTEKDHIIIHSAQINRFNNWLPNRYYYVRLKGFSFETGEIDSKSLNEVKTCKNITPESWKVNTFLQDRAKSRFVQAAALDYNWKGCEGSTLDGIAVTFNNWGISRGKETKSGWINGDTWGFYTDSIGKEKRVLLKNVSFWVNDGGKNWMDFSVDKALLDGLAEKPVTFSTKIEKIDEDSNQPYVLIEDKYKLIPDITSLKSIPFKQSK